MYCVRFSLPGSGLWHPWLAPQTMQAASNQASYLQNGPLKALVDVQETSSKAPVSAAQVNIRA